MRPPFLLVIVVGFVTSAAAQSTPTVADGSGGAKAMAATEALFSMTDGFMNAVYKSGNNAAVLDISLKLSSGGGLPSDLAWEMIKVIISAYSGFAACIIIGLLFIVLMPLTGLICCICRCCGKCGGSVPIEDPPHAKTKRIGCGALVFIFTTVALGGAVGVFLSNQAIANLLKPSNPNDGLLDHAQANLNALIGVTNATAEGLLAAPLKRLDIAQGRVTSEIGNAGNVIVNHVLNATAADDLLDFAGNITRDIPTLNRTLAATSSQLKELRNLFSSLILRLSAVKSNLSSACDAGGSASAASCHQEVDVALPRNDSLDWVQPVDGAVETIMSELVRLHSLLDITTKVKDANRTVIGAIQSTVDQASSDAASQFQNLTTQFLNVSTDLRSIFSQAVDMVPTINVPGAKRYVQEFSDIVRYVGIAIGSFFLLLVFLSYLGLCFGTCCKRPDYASSSCSKGIGANLLLAVFGLYVILSWLLMLLTTILFLVSAAKIACLAVKEPESRLPMDRLSQLQLNVDQANLTYGDIAAGLIACKNNRSVYDAGLKKVPAVNLLLDHLQVPVDTEAISRRLADVKFNGTLRDFLPDNISSSVRLLSDFAIYFNNVTLGDHVSAVERQLDAANLTAFAARIKPKFPDQANELTKIQNDVVLAIVQTLNNLSASVSDIQKRQTIVDRLKNLTSIAVAAQNLNLTVIIHEAVFRVVDSVVSIVYQEVSALQTEIKTGSSCLPIYQQLLSTADVVCTEALTPLSGMWFCIGWCIVVFIPSIAFSLVLVSLYRREEPYNATHEMAEFEAQPDGFSVFHHRDNIPLENSSRNGPKRY